MSSEILPTLFISSLRGCLQKTCIRAVSIKIYEYDTLYFANSTIERVRARARLKTFSEIAISCKSFYGRFFMFVEIRPYEKEYLSVRFKARGEDFAKILQSIKKGT